MNKVFARFLYSDIKLLGKTGDVLRGMVQWCVGQGSLPSCSWMCVKHHMTDNYA